MKKKFILSALIFGTLCTMLSSYSTGPASSAGDRTGASSSTIGCGGGCHGSSASASTSVTITVLSAGSPVTTYTPGSSYTIRLEGENTGSTILANFGYQLTAVKSSGTPTSVGTLTAPSGSHIATVGAVRVAEHTSPRPAFSGGGGFGTVYRVDIPWTAPAAGTGSVTVRGVLNAVNSFGGPDAGDKWNTATPVILTEASSAVAPITGTLSLCVGTTSTLADATAGGTWSSANPSVATISSTGVVSGVATGTATISYVASAGTATAVVTVNPNPSAITGIPVVCPGGVTTLASTPAGGTWTSSSTTTATVGASTGIVTGVTAGAAIITYALSTGCMDTAALTVTTVPAITGTGSMCVGATTTLSHAAPGGSWSSSATTIATVSTAGVVTGVAAGTANITYAFGTSGCYATTVVTVNGVPDALITGPTSVCVGQTVTLTGTPAGGTWTSSAVAKATVGASTGLVTGVATGTTTIKYKVTNACGTDSMTRTQTVTPATPCISAVFNPFAQVDELKLYPNPNKGSFALNVLSTIDEDAEITVTNIVGEKVRAFTIKTNEVNNIQLNQPAGIYFLSAVTLNNKYFVKVVVE